VEVEDGLSLPYVACGPEAKTDEAASTAGLPILMNSSKQNFKSTYQRRHRMITSAFFRCRIPTKNEKKLNYLIFLHGCTPLPPPYSHRWLQKKASKDDFVLVASVYQFLHFVTILSSHTQKRDY
jgi:hypothetical protein